MTNARLLARPVLWAVETPAAADQAYKVVNGDVFRRSWMWGRIAGWAGLKPEPFDGIVRLLEEHMAADESLWQRLAERHRLAEPDLARLASPWHTDADLGRPIEIVTDMSKSRKLGFTAYHVTDEACFSLFARLRATKLVP